MDESNQKFVVDSVNLQITVARFVDGKKVGEIPFNPARLFYPYDLTELCKQAEEQARQQWEQANGG